MSGDRSVVERFRAARRDSSLAVVEGFHALKHAVRFGAEIVEAVTADRDELRALAGTLAPDVADRLTTLAGVVDPDTFAALSPSPHPTGVIAVARRPAATLEAVLAAPGPAPLVLLERPTHHGNVGAVVRVAAAAGVAGVLVTGPHDPWHPAAIRGGAGLQFALPVLHVGAREVARAIDSDRPLVALDPGGSPLPPAGPWRPGDGGRFGPLPERAILAFGSERSGVSAELLERARHRVAIPMRAGVSSLNLATAVAVVLFALPGSPFRGPRVS